MFEFGLGQDVAVEELIADAPELTLVELTRDLQGIARTAVARRQLTYVQPSVHGLLELRLQYRRRPLLEID